MEHAKFNRPGLEMPAINRLFRLGCSESIPDSRVDRLRYWFRLFLLARWFRGSNRRWLAGVTEASVAAALLLIGVGLLTVSVTIAVMDPAVLRESTIYLALWGLMSLVLILVGLGWIIRLIWHVGVSAERRGAIAARANELEILNELRQRRADLPTVPRDPRPPVAGSTFGFRIVPSPRNLWGLIWATIFSVVSVALLSILVLICADSFGLQSQWVSQLGEISGSIAPDEISRLPERPWMAAALILLLTPACGWSIYHFFRQLLKLAGIGPTVIELSVYPLRPGQQVEGWISQSGRVRLKLFNVDLICQEEVTYNQGTDIRTETSIVYQAQLFRQRGLTLSAGKPFESPLQFEIPGSAMHSFKSTNNRIQWKIQVVAQAKNWPRLRRTFPITVHPVETDHDVETVRSRVPVVD